MYLIDILTTGRWVLRDGSDGAPESTVEVPGRVDSCVSGDDSVGAITILSALYSVLALSLMCCFECEC
jgi:hypothetical protein